MTKKPLSQQQLAAIARWERTSLEDRRKFAQHVRQTANEAGKRMGPKPIPATCRCGALCPSRTAARDHCRKPRKPKSV